MSDENALESRLDTMQRTLATLGTRIDALGARIDSLAEADAGVSVANHVDTLHSAIALLATADQLARIERELTSAHQVSAESWGEFAGLRAKVDAILETSANETGAVSRLLDEVRETLLDVASGEVLGSLWDEFRGARASIDEVLVSVERAEESARAAAESAARPDGVPDERYETLRDDVSALTAAVRELLEQAEVVDEPTGAVPDGTLTAIAADVSTLRQELAQGLVVEPSDALSGAVDQLRADVAGLDGRLQSISELQSSIAGLDDRLDAINDVQRSVSELRASTEAGTPEADSADTAVRAELQSVRDDLVAFGERMDAIADLQEAVTSLRDEVRSAAAEVAPPPALSEEVEGEIATLRSGVDGIGGDIRTLRSGIEDIIARLDEGLVLSEELAPPAADGGPEVSDQLASLRDQVTNEFDALRRLVESEAADTEPAAPPVPEVDLSAVTELLEHVRDDLAELPGRIDIPAASPVAPPAPDAYATVDPDVVDLLREEIRSAGAVPDDLLDQLRKELVALRRRIKLRAEGELLTDEQLQLIAEAVARRLEQ